jgi:hypothetical protein
VRKSYAKKYADPRWRAKRTEILERDDHHCQGCMASDVTLHVHHRYYRWGNDPWDYPNDALVTLCEDCHEGETEVRSDARAALIEAVSSYLPASDVMDLAEALKIAFDMGHAEVIGAALTMQLKNPEWVRELYERYFESLRSK